MFFYLAKPSKYARRFRRARRSESLLLPMSEMRPSRRPWREFIRHLLLFLLILTIFLLLQRQRHEAPSTLTPPADFSVEDIGR